MIGAFYFKYSNRLKIVKCQLLDDVIKNGGELCSISEALILNQKVPLRNTAFKDFF